MHKRCALVCVCVCVFERGAADALCWPTIILAGMRPQNLENKVHLTRKHRGDEATQKNAPDESLFMQKASHLQKKMNFLEYINQRWGGEK